MLTFRLKAVVIALGSIEAYRSLQEPIEVYRSLQEYIGVQSIGVFRSQQESKGVYKNTQRSSLQESIGVYRSTYEQGTYNQGNSKKETKFKFFGAKCCDVIGVGYMPTLTLALLNQQIPNNMILQDRYLKLFITCFIVNLHKVKEF